MRSMKIRMLLFCSLSTLKRTLYIDILMIQIPEVFHVYLNKCEIAVSNLFLTIFGNNKSKLVNLISRNVQQPRKYILALFARLKQSL